MTLRYRMQKEKALESPCPPARMVLKVSLAALLLAGCMGNTVDIAEMRTAIDTRLADGPSQDEGLSAIPVALSQGFAPALSAAVHANDGYRNALAQERESLELIGVTASVRAPQVSVNANAGSLVELRNGGDTTLGLSGGLNLSQLVFDAGGSAAAVNHATARALSAQAARVVRGNEIALNAAQAWVDLWQYSERLSLLRARVVEIDRLVAQIERMATTGMIDRAALDSARRQIVDLNIEQSRLEGSRAEAESAFKRYFNSAPGSVSRPPELITPARARLMAQSWQNAPLLRQHVADALAARAAVAEAQAAFRPQARLQAGASLPLEPDESSDLTIGVTLEYSFSDGGLRRRQLEAAEARLEATEAQLSDAQRSLESELVSSVARLASVERSRPLVEERLRLSRSEAETARSQLTTGQTNLRQLVEAEFETFRAEDQRILLQAERQMLLVKIAARTGGLGNVIGVD